jgi:hypothetical protein
MLVELKKLIEANPLFRDKLHFPDLKYSRLRTLINQRYPCKRIISVLFTNLSLQHFVSFCKLTLMQVRIEL